MLAVRWLRRSPDRWRARCHAGIPARPRSRPGRAARVVMIDIAASRQWRRRRPAAARPDSWRAPRGARGPRSCGCRRARPPTSESLIDRLRRSASGSGPELPMQVVQPKPTRLKPSACRGRSSQPAAVQIVARPPASPAPGRSSPRAGPRPFARPRFARQQPGASMTARVRGVGAARDRGNHHVAMSDPA